MTTLPVVGAAMTLPEFETYRAFMEEKERDLELQDFHRPDVIANDLSDLVATAKAALKGYRGRIGIHGPFWDFNIASWDPQFRALAQSYMLKAVEACGALGGGHMVVHSPYTIWDHNNLENYPNAREGLAARATETLAPIVARAESEGVTLVLENCEDIDPMFRVELARSFGSDSVKVSVDTGHAHYAHGSHNAPPVDYFIKRAGNELKHVHLQDADGHADRHWQLGRGTVNWHAVFEALAELTSQPRLIMELRNKSTVLPSHEYLVANGLAQ